MPGPVVDTPSAQEFMREIAERVPMAELGIIAGDLERKSGMLRELLRDPVTLDRPALRRVLRCVFGTRRKADRILDTVNPKRLAAAIGDLLYGADGLAQRFDRFDSVLAEPADACGGGSTWQCPDHCLDLPGELLHFTVPDRYWLWTRWVWDPGTETGALRLVTTDDALAGSRGGARRADPALATVDLAGGSSRGETYLAVGQAMAFVDETGKAAGFTAAGPGLFGTDVYLAAVYGIYMYTVLRMRMTQEFNRVVPPLPDLVRRLLGVYHLEV